MIPSQTRMLTGNTNQRKYCSDGHFSYLRKTTRRRPRPIKNAQDQEINSRRNLNPVCPIKVIPSLHRSVHLLWNH